MHVHPLRIVQDLGCFLPFQKVQRMLTLAPSTSLEPLTYACTPQPRPNNHQINPVVARQGQRYTDKVLNQVGTDTLFTKNKLQSTNKIWLLRKTYIQNILKCNLQQMHVFNCRKPNQNGLQNRVGIKETSDWTRSQISDHDAAPK